MEKAAAPAGRFRELAQQSPVTMFFLLACIFSWGLWTLMMASARGILPFTFPTNPFGSFGPAVAALLLAAARPGELKALLKALVRWRLSWRWYAVALLGPVALWGLAILIYMLLGGSRPEAAAWGEARMLPLYFFVILVLGGPLGEEPGWRGFALPKLLERMNALCASLLLSVLWLVWHLPLFWLEGSAQEGTSIPFFAAAVAAFSVLFSWIYIRTGGNLLAVILFHTSVNAVSYALGNLFPALNAAPLFDRTFTGVLLAAAAILVIAQRGIFLKRG